MRNPFRRKVLTATAEVVDAINNQGWNASPLLGGGARDRILAIFNVAQSANYSWLYENSPGVRTVIDLIVRNIGQLDLRLFEEVSDAERQPRPDHPAAMSMRYPAEGQTADGLIRGLFRDFLIHDNAYALLSEGPNNTIGLIRIPAYMVQVQGSSLFFVDNYRVWPQGAWTSGGNWGGAGRYVDFPPDQILHWRGEKPQDPRVGYSHLDTLRGIISEDAALQQANVELAQAGLTEPSWVFRPGDAPQWSNAARAGFEEDLTNRMRTRTKRPIVLEEGMEIRPFGVSPRDAQMLDFRKWTLTQIATEYGVPLGMVGLDPNVTEAQQQFYTDVLPPYCEMFTRMLNQRLLVQIYNWTDGLFAFNLDEKLQGSDRLVALTSASGRAVMLTNEARAKLNLPPVDGGDELVTPLNVVVGENPLPSVGVMPVQDPNKPPQDGSFRFRDGPPPIPAGGKQLVIPTQPVPALQFQTAPGQPIPQYHPRKAADMERQRRNVDTFQGILQRHFNALSRSLKAKAAGPDWDKFDQSLTRNLHRELQTVVQSEGDMYMLKLAAPGNFDMGQVKHYLQAMAEGAAAAINDNFRSDLEEQGVDAALAATPQHVASAGTSLGVRATTWAREEAAKQAPGYEQRVKTWIADTDRHAEWDGVTVGVGDDWPSGFAPGTAPGCACSASIT